MEIKAILSKKVNSQGGVSKTSGNQWRNDEWLLYIPGMRETHIVVEVFGVDRCKMWDDFFEGIPNKSDPVTVKFDIDAREYNGRWYNHLMAYDICMSGGW